MANNNIIIRVDGSHSLGMGHIMRCIALAYYLRQQGYVPIFVCRDYGIKIYSLIKQKGYRVLRIDRSIDWRQDAQKTIKLSKYYKAKAVITDLSNANFTADLKKYQHYLSKIKRSGIYLAAIGGINENMGKILPFCISDMVIIPYYGINKSLRDNYKNKLLLAGQKYVIYRPEFVRPNRIRKIFMGGNINVLVTMGGSDPLNLTLKVAGALRSINEKRMTIRFILGAQFTKGIGRKITSTMRSFAGKYQSIPGNNDMASHMNWADIVLTTGGLSKYEAAFIGRPAILLSQNLDEAKSTQSFEKAGLAMHLGFGKGVTAEMIKTAVSRVIHNPASARLMAARGRNKFDGKGASRIIKELNKELNR